MPIYLQTECWVLCLFIYFSQSILENFSSVSLRDAREISTRCLALWQQERCLFPFMSNSNNIHPIIALAPLKKCQQFGRKISEENPLLYVQHILLFSSLTCSFEMEKIIIF